MLDVGGALTSLKKYRAIWGIAAIVLQYGAIWCHSDFGDQLKAFALRGLFHRGSPLNAV